jgi:hypothetical protein
VSSFAAPLGKPNPRALTAKLVLKKCGFNRCRTATETMLGHWPIVHPRLVYSARSTPPRKQIVPGIRNELL